MVAIGNKKKSSGGDQRRRQRLCRQIPKSEALDALWLAGISDDLIADLRPTKSEGDIYLWGCLLLGKGVGDGCLLVCYLQQALLVSLLLGCSFGHIEVVLFFSLLTSLLSSRVEQQLLMAQYLSFSFASSFCLHQLRRNISSRTGQASEATKATQQLLLQQKQQRV